MPEDDPATAASAISAISGLVLPNSRQLKPLKPVRFVKETVPAAEPSQNSLENDLAQLEELEQQVNQAVEFVRTDAEGNKWLSDTDYISPEGHRCSQV